MATINELKKKYDINKDELITGLDEDELKRTILQRCKAYYVSYFNNDEKEYKATLNIIEFIEEIYSSVNEETDYYNNVPNFINYCMLLSINMILSDLFERNFTLKEPYFTDLKERRYTSILESFNDVDELPALWEIFDKSDLMKMDADLETVKSIYPQLQQIFTSHGIGIIDDFIASADKRKAIMDDKKYGWRKDL